MIHHILFATDGSFPAERAADYADSIAVRFHAKVTVLHAYNAVSASSPAYTFPNVGAFAQRVDADSPVKSAAETLKPDRIILGARGVSTWQGGCAAGRSACTGGEII